MSTPRTYLCILSPFRTLTIKQATQRLPAFNVPKKWNPFVLLRFLNVSRAKQQIEYNYQMSIRCKDTNSFDTLPILSISILNQML